MPCCKATEDVTFVIERAPEPSDVFWENMGVTLISRVYRVFLVFFSTMILICGCFGCIYGLDLVKRSLNKAETSS
jgi:hypothetical protein